MKNVNTGGEPAPTPTAPATLEERQADGDRARAAEERAPVDGVLPDALRARPEAFAAPRLPVDDGTGISFGVRFTGASAWVRNALFLTRSMIICLTDVRGHAARRSAR